MQRGYRFRWLVSAVLGLFVAGCGSNATAPKYSLQAPKFTSPEGGFAVWLPGTPSQQTQSQPTPAGLVQVHLYQVADGDVAYLVAYNEIPLLLQVVKPEVLLAGGREGMLKGRDAKLVSEKPITLGGYPGLEVIAEASHEKISGGVLLKLRVFVARDRLYRLLAIAPKNAAPLTDVDGFLDSFTLAGVGSGR